MVEARKFRISYHACLTTAHNEAIEENAGSLSDDVSMLITIHNPYRKKVSELQTERTDLKGKRLREATSRFCRGERDARRVSLL